MLQEIEWYPIEGAPKTGQCILLLAMQKDNPIIFSAFWSKSYGCWLSGAGLNFNEYHYTHYAFIPNLPRKVPTIEERLTRVEKILNVC